MKKWYLFLAPILIIALTTCEKEGKEGIKSIVKISSVSPNEACSNGGQKIEVGLDKNRNSLLDSSEVESTNYVCNGTNGVDGLNSLANLTKVDPSSTCETGGFRIDIGFDKNRNNILDDNEIESTRYICNGINGSNSLSNLTKINPSDICETGGFKIDIGIDKNKNNILDANEIESTNYVCNGVNGLNSLTNLTEVSPYGICEAGGFKIDVGIDKNRNNILDINEIESTKYVCNGVNGGYDKQIMFQLGRINSAAKDTFINTIQNSGCGLLLFNKANYTKIDSAVLIVYDVKTASGCCGAPDLAKKVKIELYDLINNNVILNSEIESDDITQGTYVRSGNIINKLPNSYTNFGVRMIFDKNYYAQTGFIYLVLYRSE